MKKLKRDDEVLILTGKDKGKKGKVLRIIEDRLLVEGINKVHKHVKPNPQKNIKGGIVIQESSIHASNVALINSATGKAGRVGFETNEQGVKVRCFRSESRRGVS